MDNENNCPICGALEVVQDLDFDTMSNCCKCGSEWVTSSREDTLNSKEI
jgi:hypothetical protein